MGMLSWLKRRRLDDNDFQDEIHAHLAMAEQERIAEGAERDVAHYAARALALVLAGVLLATIVPAWRASRTNPLSALRHQ